MNDDSIIFLCCPFIYKKGGVTMATRGNKPLKKKESITTPVTLHCLSCNEVFI